MINQLNIWSAKRWISLLKYLKRVYWCHLPMSTKCEKGSSLEKEKEKLNLKDLENYKIPVLDGSGVHSYLGLHVVLEIMF